MDIVKTLPGHFTSAGGIYNEVGWSFLIISMLSAAFSCESKSMPHRKNIWYLICY